MSPSLNLHLSMLQYPTSAVANGLHSHDEGLGSFDLRDTLTAMAVCELSFAEFRAALEKCGKRLG
jgi:hypothetical protein